MATPSMAAISNEISRQLSNATNLGTSFAYDLTNRLVPLDTQDAVMCLLRELSMDVPKDKQFFSRHANRLSPKTALGWIMATSLCCLSASAIFIACTLTLAVSVCGVLAGMALMATCGLAVAVAMGMLSMFLLGSAVMASIVGGTIMLTLGVPFIIFEALRSIARSAFGDVHQVPASVKESHASLKQKGEVMNGLPKGTPAEVANQKKEAMKDSAESTSTNML